MAQSAARRRTPSQDPLPSRKTAAPQPARAHDPALSALGGQSSAAAIARLMQSIVDLKAQAIRPLLDQAILAVSAERPQEGAELALKALEVDERSALAWHVLALCRDKVGDFTSALRCYESALALDPHDVDLPNDLGRLAYRMGMKPLAEQFFRLYTQRNPDCADGANNLACALRDQSRFGEAIDVVRLAIYAHPERALLWNTLGTILTERGDIDQAVSFYDEALRLEPDFVRARYNRGNARLALGDPAGALEDCEAAIPGAAVPAEAAMMEIARATMLLAAGDLERGWAAYERRLHPDYGDVTHFMIDRPQWTPESDIADRSLLVIGEQGLGDEVLFANAIPDVLEALGPDARLTIAVEPRLVPLFQRSFPSATVGAHATFKVEHKTVRTLPFLEGLDEIDLWAPLASLLRRYRREVEAFPNRPRFLTPDADRVAYWCAALDGLGAGPKIGLSWKSLRSDSARQRYYSPFDAWRPVLATPGARFVNVQYGDCSAELARAREELGVDIWDPPGIDLKDDLDEVAALSCALDLVIGPANATTNIAAACGAALWLISAPGAWPRLGTGRYPWYPQARVFTPPAFNRWEPVMSRIAGALQEAGR